MIEVLKQALAHAKLNERHQTVAESYYWLRQYKLLAEKAIAELESQEPKTDKDAMKLALDALENQIANVYDTESNAYKKCAPAITALKERLAQPEPIQSLQCFHCQVTIETLNDKVMHLMAERTWAGLTNEEIDQICGDVGYGYIDVAKAIEAKLKEKNT
jgi:hypothetical protein